jgi:hypothetical protein
MTLRLVLVGLVAALGLTIPRLSHQSDGVEAASDVLTNHQVGSSRRPARSVITGHRSLRSSNFYAHQRYQPVGYGSGVVRPLSKRVMNFWQVPNGSRVVAPSRAVAAVSHPAKSLRRDFEPIEVDDARSLTLADVLNRDSEGLSFPILGPPARLKAKPTAVRLNLATARIQSIKSGLEAAAGNLGRRIGRINRIGRTVWTGWNSFAADLRAKQASIAATAAGPAAPRIIDEQTLPDDVFAPAVSKPEPRPVVLADLPDDVFAPGAPKVEPKRVVLADLPDDVFAPGIAKPEPRPVVLADLPDDVFAPEIAAPARVPATTTPIVSNLPSRTGPAAGSAVAVQNPEHLTQAVSLTRDAAVAWMKLLSGPAVVTLHR